MYVSIKPNETKQLLAESLSHVKRWLAASLLLLNDTKTEAIIFGAKAALCPQYDFSFLPNDQKPLSRI